MALQRIGGDWGVPVDVFVLIRGSGGGAGHGTPAATLDVIADWVLGLRPNMSFAKFLTSLQQRLVKTGGRLIKHARYYWLLLAESHLTQRLFGGMLAKIAMLPSPAGQSECKAEQISMTTPGMQREVSSGSMGKTASSAVGEPVQRETGISPALLGTTRSKIG